MDKAEGVRSTTMNYGLLYALFRELADFQPGFSVVIV